MRIVMYIMIFFISVSMLVMCKATKPLVTKQLPDSTANIAPPAIEVNSVSLDKPITISFAGKDTVKKIELTVTTPVKTVFDTTAFNNYVTRYFTDFKRNFYSIDEEVRNTERLIMINKIEAQIEAVKNANAREARLKDTIAKLKLKNKNVEKAADAAETATYNTPIIVGLFVFGFCLFIFLLYRCMKQFHKMRHAPRHIK